MQPWYADARAEPEALEEYDRLYSWRRRARRANALRFTA
jgi:hypothetical protein